MFDYLSIAIIAVRTLVSGSVIAYKLYYYESVPGEWALTLLAFIVLLPFLFFLIIWLHLTYYMTQRVSELKNRLRASSTQILYRSRIEEDDPQNRLLIPDSLTIINIVDFHKQLQLRDAFVLNYDPDCGGDSDSYFKYFGRKKEHYPMQKKTH